jgi:membrane protein implicated in regulation of membrane protease activity
MAGVIVRYLYRQQKREHGKLSVWRWVGIIVIGVLSLILPLISWWYGVKIFLIYAVMYSITVIVYLILSNRKTVSHSFEKEALANSYSGNTMESGDHFKKRGESEKPDE